MINSKNPLRVRGYSSWKKEWVYGFGATDVQFNERYAQETGVKERMYVYTDYGPVEVDPGTVGRYLSNRIESTGLDLYEGDIITVTSRVNYYMSATVSKRVTIDSLDDIPYGPQVQDITLAGNIVEGVTSPIEEKQL